MDKRQFNFANLIEVSYNGSDRAAFDSALEAIRDDLGKANSYLRRGPSVSMSKAGLKVAAEWHFQEAARLYRLTVAAFPRDRQQLESCLMEAFTIIEDGNKWEDAAKAMKALKKGK